MAVFPIIILLCFFVSHSLAFSLFVISSARSTRWPWGPSFFKLILSFLCQGFKLKPIPTCLKAQTANRLPARRAANPLAPHSTKISIAKEREREGPCRRRDGSKVGCFMAALTQWSDRVRFVFGGFGKSGTVSSSFRQKGKARRSRTAEHDNQLYFMSLYSNVLHPQHLSPHRHPSQHTQAHFEDGSPWRKNTFSPFPKVRLAQIEAEKLFMRVSTAQWRAHCKKWTP